MLDPRGRWYLIAAGLIGAAVSCSLLVERRDVQCKSDADCASFGGAACDLKTNACVAKACANQDCVCNPTAPNDILNGCPKGKCSPYDNGEVKGLVDGSVPPIPMGTGGAPAPTYSCNTGTDGGSGGKPDAGAPPLCESLPNPLYLLGPTSIQPLLAWVAQLYAQKNITVVFQSDSSCVAMQHIFDQPVMESDPGNEEWTIYYDAEGAQHPCRIGASNVPLDIAISDVFPQTCNYDRGATDPTVVDTFGPVQAMGFIVPTASTETSISAEAAYMAFGFGGASGPSPWTDERYLFQRDAVSGTQNMIGAAIGLDPKQFRASSSTDSDNLAALVGCSPQPQKTLGILAVDLAQSGLYPVKLLAYQHYHQDCGYLPDDQPGDKRNVRDGHYFIWGPVHLLTRTTHQNSNATLMINYVSGISPAPPNAPDIFKVWTGAHLVPQCAMHVTRSIDGGPISIPQKGPAAPCYCKYDEVAVGSSSCARCTTSADCTDSTASTCSYGYCEP